METTPRVVRWNRPEPPLEAEVRRALEAEGLQPYRWANGPGYVYGEHDHPYHKVLVPVRGGIRFIVQPGEQAIDLQPGDRFELPARTRHAAYIGPAGVICLEAARR